MAEKYKTVQKNVTAIQFTFDVLKDIYLFLNYGDVVYSVKSRTLSGVVTGKDGVKLNVNKTDWIVKESDGTITVWKDDEFKKEFVKSE